MLPSDLGEAAMSGDGRCALVSFISNPLVVGRENTWVLFVTDPVLATAADSFEWSLVEEGSAPNVQTSDHGEFSFSPSVSGALTLTVRILAAGAEQASLTLAQDVVELNEDLETLISDAGKEPGPGIGNPETARELVNEHNPYYQAVALQTPESDDSFKVFVFSMVSDGALQRSPSRRKEHLEALAGSLNGPDGDFATLAAEGAGVCGLRLALVAMTLPAPLLAWTELPVEASPRAVADEQVRQSLAALDEAKRIDLFNIGRFPKSNIKQCARILETLRDHYFSGTSFHDVLTGMSGTRADWMIRHFRAGPLTRT
jgi:hypothetical protein